MKAIQYIDSFHTEDQAIEAFDGLRLQDTYLGGRILQPNNISGPMWHVQVFYEAFERDLAADHYWLPDGCRVVIIPDGQRCALGIEQERIA